MTPEKIVVALLTADSAVTALVSTRIHPSGVAQAESMPAVVVEVISDVPQPPINASAGLSTYTARVQVSCCALTYTESRQLGAAARAALHAKYGVVAGVQLVSALLALRGPDMYDHETGIYINPLDFSITYRE